MENAWYIVLVVAVLLFYVDSNLLKWKIAKYLYNKINLPKIELTMSPDTRKALIYGTAIVISAAIISFAYLYSNRYQHITSTLIYDKWKHETINVIQP